MAAKMRNALIGFFIIILGCLLFTGIRGREYLETAAVETCQQHVYESVYGKAEDFLSEEEIRADGEVGLYEKGQAAPLQNGGEKNEDENGDKKVVYLTFDDGPSKNTPKILDILKKYDIKATFFVVGSDTEFGKKMYKRIVSEGHGIGNHTYSHRYDIVYSSVEAYMEDTEKLNELIYEATGVRPDIIRFPGGSNNHASWSYGGKGFMKDLIKEVKARGYDYFDWNVSSTDASKPVLEKQKIIDAVIKGVGKRKKAIVLMHDSSMKTTTVEALPEIIEKLQDEGYSFGILRHRDGS